MKRIVFSIAVLAAFGMSVIGYSGLVNEGTWGMSNDMQDVEALSGCEVSSDASKNQGYCSPIYNGNGDACTEDGNGGAVRCSGSF